MKIALLSDIHLDVNSSDDQGLGRDISLDVASFIQSLDVDRIVIAGDVAESAVNCLSYLEYIETNAKKPISFIPGNHDVWTEGTSSWDEYNMYRNHHTSLIDLPLQLTDKYVLVGNMGWYDYTFGLPEYKVEEFITHRPKNWDVKAKFHMSDPAFANILMDQLQSQLENCRQYRVLLVTHFVPYTEFLVRKPDSPEWNWSNSFMGSRRIGEIINLYPNIEYVVFGHTHMRFGMVNTQGRKVICKPLGYVHEWESPDLNEELKRVTTIISLDE
ncbi:metallophosphoesterase [Alicyclobacillus fastidiosus]|uniref:Metallophosphoesterase n=1 Tax=Alicyclobacillus fastidiosus TaxID=392011 RepID=A0ABY6ZMP1_9BACL|nr:metallophosphoesterase [Alicyclobacillus fastidiosus]WAH43391.1 metallophosphoesterase [Alicyclobacillus fastidiosus]GMA65457.1 phosphohydrolase [Alicyclobacillus fastidiosus]